MDTDNVLSEVLGTVPEVSTEPEHATTKRHRYGVSEEEFVSVYNSSDSPDAAAISLNMPKTAVQTRASLYRKKGLPVKYFNNRQVKTVIEIPG